MTQQPTIDATYSKLGDCEFNKDENWEGGRVPDGTGTVYASNCLNSRLTFTQRITTLRALRLLQGTGIELAAGQTLNLGQGIYANDGGYQLEIRNNGTINGGVHIAGRASFLEGDGTINGNVIFEMRHLIPGGIGGLGTLTVNGSLVLGKIDMPVDVSAFLHINGAANGSSNRLLVNGPVEIPGDHALVNLIPTGPEKDYPPRTTYTVLTAKGGFKGKLQLNPFSWWPTYEATLAQDDHNVSVTL